MPTNKTKNKKFKKSVQHDALVKKKTAYQINSKGFPRSYRLDPEVMDTLKNTVGRINEVSPRKVSEARLVKALILLSREVDNEKLMKYLKEVW